MMTEVTPKVTPAIFGARWLDFRVQSPTYRPKQSAVANCEKWALSGVTSGVTLYLNLVRFGALLCATNNPRNALIISSLCRSVQACAQGCKKAVFWTQNPPRATSWGFAPSRHQLTTKDSLEKRETKIVWWLFINCSQLQKVATTA